MDQIEQNTNILKNILCPAGDGVFTVETAKEKKEGLQSKLYGSGDYKSVWEKQLESIPSKELFLLGIPSDNGGGILRGANWGPLFLRESISGDFFDLGDIRVVPHLLHDKYLNDETISSVRNALFGSDLELPVSPLSIAELAIETVLKLSKRGKVFSLGGDHSVSAGSVPPFVRHYENLGILHFDAHTDLLEERLGIDKCFATWAANVLPSLENPANIIQVGIRRSGKDRGHWEKKFGLNQYWADKVKSEGPSAIAEKLIEQYKNLGIKDLYISFDIDAIDSEYASATGTPETGGLPPHEASVIIDQVGKEFNVVGGDMVEVAPFINHYGSAPRLCPEPESTLDVAGQLSNKIIRTMQS